MRQNVPGLSELIVVAVYAQLLHIFIELRPLDGRRNEEHLANKRFCRLLKDMDECELFAEGILNFCGPGA